MKSMIVIGGSVKSIFANMIHCTIIIEFTLYLPRWKLDPAYPNPFSPVHKARKFSAVFGTTSARSSITIRPQGFPPMDMSKYTFGLDLEGRTTKKVEEIQYYIKGEYKS